MNIVILLFFIIGVGMIGFWLMAYISKSIPEVKTEPVRIIFHIAAEIVTGLLLILSGLAVLLCWSCKLPLSYFACGMLAYTAIVSPGYYAQQKKWGMVVMFAVVLILDAIMFLSLQ